MMDNDTKETLKKIPLLKEKAGPRETEDWEKRLKEEYGALIQYVKMTKENDSAWFSIQSNKSGTKLVSIQSSNYVIQLYLKHNFNRNILNIDDLIRWFGKCWFIHNLLKYEFKVEFEVGLEIVHL